MRVLSVADRLANVPPEPVMHPPAVDVAKQGDIIPPTNVEVAVARMVVVAVPAVFDKSNSPFTEPVPCIGPAKVDVAEPVWLKFVVDRFVVVAFVVVELVMLKPGKVVDAAVHTFP